MDKNQQDRTGSKTPATEDKSPLSPSSFQDQRRPDRPQNNQSVEHPRDWLQLLIIPLLIALVGIGFTWVQNQTSLQIANDQQQETILKTYLDNMSDLLLTQHLSTSKPEVREVAKERTLTTLRRLDANRNTIVLRFLQDAHLIGIKGAVIDLSNADLSNDDLSGTDLSGTDLSGAKLSGAKLSGATLIGTNLNGADLSGTTLKRANLSDAFLNGANLNGADLSGADLSGADLRYANLSKAILNSATLNGAIMNGGYLSYAILNGANLIGANLKGADLSYADLSYADLSYADLNGAILNGADLSYAHLNGARNLAQPQLNTGYSCTNAMLSTRFTCPYSRSVVTLTYWYTESTAETPVILQLIQQFQRQNPNIKINAVYKQFPQEAQTAFVTAAQVGNAPDVLRSDASWVTQFASQGYLFPIDSYVSQSDLSDYQSVPLRYDPLSNDQYQGHLYGLPQVTDFLALLYNRAELAKVGFTSPSALATMADFEAAAKKIMKSKAATYGFETAGTSYYVLPFLGAFGGGMIDQHNNILVKNAGSVAGLTFLLKLQNNDKVMPPKVDFNNGYNNMVNNFKSGKTAMIFDGPWEVSNIQTGFAFTGNTSNLGIAPIPIDRSGDQPRSPLGGQSYVISAGTAHPAEAYKFISFMSSTPSQVAIAKANHTLPTRNSAYQDPSVSSDPVISAFYAIKNTAVARPVIPQGGLLFDAFDPNIGAALDGAKSPADALNAVADAWKQLLAG